MMTESVLYIVLSIPWAVAGFLAGFTAGVKANLWSRTMSPAIVERPTETPSRNPEDGPKAVPWYRRSQTWIGGAVAAIGIVTGVTWYSSGQETARLVECQNAYANGAADALEARAKAQQSVTDAQDGLWFLIDRGLTAPTPEIRDEFKAKLSDYVHAREEAKKTQATNPYPEAPREVCR